LSFTAGALVAIGVHYCQQLEVFGLNNFFGHTVTRVIHDDYFSIELGVLALFNSLHTVQNIGSKITSDELYVSVDVETSGPVPGIYSLLSVGACVVSSPLSQSISSSSQTAYNPIRRLSP